MGFKQADIFGGHKEIKKKTAVPKKKKENKLLKQKIDILYRMYEELYKKQNIGLLEQRDAIIKNNIIAYPEEKLAEPIEIINLSIYDIDKRIEKMKEVLNV